MKTWRKYEEYLTTGEWHVHTSYTDGENTVFELCRAAVDLGIPLIAFTEHVRRELTYDFNSLLADIERARGEFPELIILSGVEAKVLPDCSLDVCEDIIREVDYPIFAFHSFPDDLELYIRCLKEVIKNRYVNTWAHPGLFLKGRGLTLEEETVREILGLMKRSDVLLEVNSKYNLPPGSWLGLAEKMGVKVVRGDDIHSLEQMFGAWKGGSKQ